MNWKLILQLSLFGLAMGIGTVFVIPSTIEPFCWLAIFLICAYIIGGRAVPHPFLHGLAIGIVNSVWVTGSHVLFFSQYVANHPKEMEMMKSMPMPFTSVNAPITSSSGRRFSCLNGTVPSETLAARSRM